DLNVPRWNLSIDGRRDRLGQKVRYLPGYTCRNGRARRQRANELRQSVSNCRRHGCCTKTELARHRVDRTGINCATDLLCRQGWRIGMAKPGCCFRAKARRLCLVQKASDAARAGSDHIEDFTYQRTGVRAKPEPTRNIAYECVELG